MMSARISSHEDFTPYTRSLDMPSPITTSQCNSQQILRKHDRITIFTKLFISLRHDTYLDNFISRPMNFISGSYKTAQQPSFAIRTGQCGGMVGLCSCFLLYVAYSRAPKRLVRRASFLLLLLHLAVCLLWSFWKDFTTGKEEMERNGEIFLGGMETYLCVKGGCSLVFLTATKTIYCQTICRDLEFELRIMIPRSSNSEWDFVVGVLMCVDARCEIWVCCFVAGTYRCMTL